MKNFLKHYIVAFALICTGIIVNGQVKIDIPENAKFEISKHTVAILMNNGKRLSQKGASSIYHSGITSMIVRKDTVYVSVKDTVLKKLDKDKGNYFAKTKTSKNQSTKK